MKKKTKLWRYLFKLPLNIYNNNDPYYEVNPLPGSDQKRLVLFAGKQDSAESNLAIVYLYLELSAELSDKNTFANLQRVLNLVHLETGLPTRFVSIPVDGADDFDSLLSKFSSNDFSHPGASYSGTAPQNNHIARVKACADLWAGLNKKDFEKCWME